MSGHDCEPVSKKTKVANHRRSMKEKKANENARKREGHLKRKEAGQPG